MLSRFLFKNISYFTSFNFSLFLSTLNLHDNTLTWVKKGMVKRKDDNDLTRGSL